MKKNKVNYQIFLLLISLFVLLFFQACNLINLDKAEPEKTFFSFDEIKENKPVRNPKKQLPDLILMEFTTTSEFKGNQFIYKNNNNYIRDYYNRFFSLPEKTVETRCVKWLSNTERFNSVSSAKSQLSFSDLVLKGEILEIYCDRSDSNTSYAVIKIKFNLLEYNETDKNIMGKNLYSKIKFDGFTPEDLISAWTRCLEDILQNLETEISSFI